MEISSNYILFIFVLILVVVNAFTTKEAVLFPLYSVGKKALIIAMIWLVPVVGLVVAYKILHLHLSTDTTNGGDGAQLYSSESTDDDAADN